MKPASWSGPGSYDRLSTPGLKRAGLPGTREATSLSVDRAVRRRLASAVTGAAPYVGLAVAAILWVVSVLTLDPRRASDIGLISALPASYFAAMVVLIVSFAIAVTNRETSERLLFLHVAQLVALIHGTPSLAYGTLRYSWAYRHVGIVDYIQRFGAVDPHITFQNGLDAYHNWPGFFALGALLTEAAGFKNALPLATVAPFFFTLLYIGALLLIVRALTRDRRLQWLAIWTFFLGDWVGQDYFAPQTFGFFLSLVILGILLNWFGDQPGPLPADARSTGKLGRLRSLWNWLIRLEAGPGVLGERPAPLRRVGLMAIVILAVAAIVGSHQLTPFMTALAVGALVVARRCDARTLPVLIGVMTGLWIAYMAWAFVGPHFSWIVESVGAVDQNAAGFLTRPNAGQLLVTRVALGLSGLVALLAAAGALRRLLNGRIDLRVALLAGAPVPMIFANSYGGEMNFRVYFFALPFLAFFAAALVFPRRSSGRSWWTPIQIVVTSTVLVAGLMIAYYGHEEMNYFTPQEVEAVTHVYDIAPPGSLILSASFNYPTLFTRSEQFNYAVLTDRTSWRAGMRDDPVGTAVDIMSLPQFPATYLVVTRSQTAQLVSYNVLSQEESDRMMQRLRQSGKLKVIYENKDAVVFVLSGNGSQR